MSSPKPKPRRIYWDACVFLSLVEGTPDRRPSILAVIDESEHDRCEIYTSLLSITEVAFAKSEKDGKALSAATEKKIDKLWSTASPFRLVEIHRPIVEDAKRLIRLALSKGVSLKPPDVIHLATAKRVGAKFFQTYDEFRGKSSDIAGLSGLTIEKPWVDGNLVWSDSGESEGKPRPRRRKGKKADGKPQSE